MKYISLAILSLSLFCGQTHAAETYTNEFTSSIARNITCQNIDGGTLDATVYRTNYNTSTTWVFGKTDASNGAALCPTHNSDGSVRISRMTLPAIDVKSADAVVIWDGKSMLHHVPEAYRVIACVSGSNNWTTLAEVDAESYFWTTHSASLKDFVGKTVQVAFESATNRQDAFMIAVDNVYIGVPSTTRFTYQSTTPRFFGLDDDVAVTGSIVSYGSNPGWTALRVIDNDNGGAILGSQAITSIAPLQPIEVNIPIEMTLGQTLNYSLVAVKSNGSTDKIESEFISLSYFARTLFMDKFTGTWCNNCPEESLKVHAYEKRFGNNLIVVECHMGNDILACADYVNKYASEFIFSVPQLGLNRNRATVNSAKDYEKAFNQELTIANTIAAIDAFYTLSDDGATVKITSTAKFAQDMDNSSDRYRVAYILLADVHNPTNYGLIQSNYAFSTASGEYYYSTANILSKMMKYTNVVTEASKAVNGVPASLPAAIYANDEMQHSVTLTIPATYRQYPLKVAALIIDTQDTGYALNSALAKEKQPSQVSIVEANPTPNSNIIYDIMGRPVNNVEGNLAPGIYIKDGRKIFIH